MTQCNAISFCQWGITKYSRNSVRHCIKGSFYIHFKRLFRMIGSYKGKHRLSFTSTSIWKTILQIENGVPHNTSLRPSGNTIFILILSYGKLLFQTIMAIMQQILIWHLTVKLKDAWNFTIWHFTPKFRSQLLGAQAYSKYLCIKLPWKHNMMIMHLAEHNGILYRYLFKNDYSYPSKGKSN